jgi:hypothetical protein
MPLAHIDPDAIPDRFFFLCHLTAFKIKRHLLGHYFSHFSIPVIILLTITTPATSTEKRI